MSSTTSTDGGPVGPRCTVVRSMATNGPGVGATAPMPGLLLTGNCRHRCRWYLVPSPWVVMLPAVPRCVSLPAFAVAGRSRVAQLSTAQPGVSRAATCVSVPGAVTSGPTRPCNFPWRSARACTVTGTVRPVGAEAQGAVRLHAINYAQGLELEPVPGAGCSVQVACNVLRTFEPTAPCER